MVASLLGALAGGIAFALCGRFARNPVRVFAGLSIAVVLLYIAGPLLAAREPYMEGEGGVRPWVFIGAPHRSYRIGVSAPPRPGPQDPFSVVPVLLQQPSNVLGTIGPPSRGGDGDCSQGAGDGRSPRDDGSARLSGVVICDTLISSAVVSASYTPGAVNIW